MAAIEVISYLKVSSYFWPTSHLNTSMKLSRYFLSSFESTGFSVREKKRKIDFEDGGYLGFPIWTFYLFLIYMLPWCFLSRFESIGLSVQEKKWKIEFQIGTNLLFFYLQVIPMLLSITKTRLYNFDPLKPHFYIVKLGFTGVYIIFLISAQKHRLWVLVT